jgi:superfamily II DNA or RNA helicase
VKIEVGNLTSTLVAENGRDELILSKVKTKMRVMAPGALYMKEHQRYRKTGGRLGWDGKVNMLVKNNFLTGCVSTILPLLETFVYEDKRGIRPPTLKPMQIDREYQKAAIRASFQNTMFNHIWWPRGVLDLATGSGKTKTAGEMIRMSGVPTAFIVHRTHLVEQTKEEFESLGLQCGVVQASRKDTSNQLTIATVQTLYNHIQNQKDLAWTLGIHQLFIDEAHLVGADLNKGNIFVNVANLFENAYMRWGLTGTAFRRDEYSDLLLQGVTGSTIYKAQNKDLIEEGFLAPPKIKVISHDVKLVPRTWPQCYDVGIVLNKKRNEMVIKEALKATPPCLIFVDQVTHGRLLQEESNKQGTFIPMLCGDSTSDERLEAVAKLKDGRLTHIIATTIFDEGMNAPHLRSIVLAGAKQSSIKYLQRIGRGLRTYSGKTHVDVVDFYERGHKILERHATKRLDIWKAEGFDVQLI